jgi:hypothetical protein
MFWPRFEEKERGMLMKWIITGNGGGGGAIIYRGSRGGMVRWVTWRYFIC